MLCQLQIFLMSQSAVNLGTADIRASDMGYKHTSAYTQRASAQQIITLLLFIGVLAMHSVFIVPAAAESDHPILWVLVGCTYVLLLLMFYDYCYLTCSDPVDDLILGVKKNYSDLERVTCTECQRVVHRESYHCHTCNRCTQYFDHHCKYLNNCIGGKNYLEFFRLLTTVTAYCLSIVGEGIWVFVEASDDEHYRNSIISRWGTLATIIYTFIVVFIVDTLLCFHCYLVFYLKTSTVKYLHDEYKHPSEDNK